jgi:hypothetical protein
MYTDSDKQWVGRKKKLNADLRQEKKNAGCLTFMPPT